MRRFAPQLSLLLSLLVCLISACRSYEASQADVLSTGRIEGDTLYINEALGLSISLPDGWNVTTAEERKAMGRPTKTVNEKNEIMLIDLMSRDLTDIFGLDALPESPREARFEQDYARMQDSLVKATGVAATTSVVEEMNDGMPFVNVKTVAKKEASQGKWFTSETHIYRKKGWIVYIMYFCTDRENHDEADRAARSISFQ